MMRCRNVRDRLIDGSAPGTTSADAVRRHLDDCPECRIFADRLVAVRAGLRSHLTRVDPGAGFAARVAGELPEVANPLGWAALRVLPATLALALVLAGWALLAPPPAEILAESPTDDLIGWVLTDAAAEDPASGER